jgi:hypothetical protein
MSTQKRSAIGTLAFGSLAWLLACTFIILPLWPFLPKARLQWQLLIVFGPPLYGLGAYLGDRLLPGRVGSRMSPQRHSIVRGLFAVLVMLTLYLAVIVAARLLGVFN